MMPVFIYVTEGNGRSTYINASHIISIQGYELQTVHGTRTQTRILIGLDGYNVVEPPDEVMRRINDEIDELRR